MYTEDDEKVKVKKNNSNNDYNDFYTSFNNDDDDDNKKKKEPKVKTKKKFARRDKREVKDETDYSDFYGTDNDEDNSENNNDNGNKSKIIKIAVITLLAIILIVLLIILLTGGNKADIELTSDKIDLTAGESDYISYKIVNTDSEVKSSFTSSNPDVAMVDEFGKVTAISNGETIITIKYSIDGKVKEKTCKIVVTGGSSVDQKLSLDVTFSNGSDDEWTNKDVTLMIKANSIFGIEAVKYATNCDSNCDYRVMNGDRLTISSSGETKVKILATDKQKQEVTKEVTVKIDKEAPKVTYTGNTTIESKEAVEVCVTCSDNLSGCKESKVCKKYTSSKSNQVIAVYDKAGNKNNSPSFNVKITKISEPCKLSVSSDGTVTATLREEATYYGFNSSYSGTNEKSKKITINASKAGESGAQVVYYYVKNKNGSGGMCYATVIKECKCKDGSSSSSSCEVKCTFRIN